MFHGIIPHLVRVFVAETEGVDHSHSTSSREAGQRGAEEGGGGGAQ